MMAKIISWIKRNKALTLIIVVLLFFFAKDYLLGGFFGVSQMALTQKSYVAPTADYGAGEMALTPVSGGISNTLIPGREAAPVEQEERLVVEESSMSLVVKNVREATDKIVDQAKSVGGYMVSSTLTSPEEAPFATVVVRVPADDFRATLDYFRNMAVKVTSENIKGRDVTDEYVDIESRIATLEKTKAKFEAIMEMATEVQDILNVQRQIISLQEQIDSLKGRQNYLEQTAKLAKITIYLSTDEYALPYAPAETFRPQVIFKLAVRSLVRTLRSFAKALIWIGVYAVIWIPIALIVYFVWRWRKKKAPLLQK